MSRKKQRLHDLEIQELARNFDNVPKKVWDFHIGGYKVLDKYLKDHKDITLNLDEIENIENIIKVLFFTIVNMKIINKFTIEWI